MIQGLLYLQSSRLFMCVIIYKPCIIFALCICPWNLLRCWDIHSRADIQLIFLCLKPVAMCVLYRETPFWFSQALRQHACFGVLLFVSAPGHHLYRHPAFPSHDHMKASSADTLGAGLSDLKLSGRTGNWIPSGKYFATSSDHSNLHFLGLCWRLLKSGTFTVLGIIFSTASFFFSLVFLCLFWFFLLRPEGFAEPLHCRGGILQGPGASAFLVRPAVAQSMHGDFS